MHTWMTSSSFWPTRRARISFSPAAVSKLQPVLPFTTGMENGQASSPMARVRVASSGELSSWLWS
jgi:hypothetical protein